MAINVASKYSSKVVERYSKKSLTDKGLNKDYDWAGVKTVTVYSVPTVAMNDYSRTGASRYGTPAELQNTKQDLTLTKDRSFTFTVDKGNLNETMGIMEAGKALARQTDEVFTPELDTYRLGVWAAATGTRTTGVAVAITDLNAYTKFLDAQELLDESLIPETGRICYAVPKYIKFLKLDDNFIKACDLAQNMLIKNQVGEVDGIAIVKVPTTRMPSNCTFILIHPACSCSPLKLEDFKIHDNPPGINGKLIEGRYIYDTFVFETLGNSIIKHMSV